MGLKVKTMEWRRRTVWEFSTTVSGTDPTPVTFFPSKQHRFVFHESEEMVCDKQPYSNDALQGKSRKSVGLENAGGTFRLTVQFQHGESESDTCVWLDAVAGIASEGIDHEVELGPVQLSGAFPVADHRVWCRDRSPMTG